MRARKVLLGVSATWLLTATRVVNTVALMPLYYRFLEPGVLGAWILFASLGSFLLFADLGLAMVFSRSLALHKGLGNRGVEGADAVLLRALGSAGPRDLFFTISRAYAGLGLAIFVVGGSLGWWYLGTIGLGPQQGMVREAWILYALGLCFVVAASTPNHALRGLGDVGIEEGIETATVVAACLATALVLFCGGDVRILAIVFLARQITTRAVLALILRRRHPWLFEGQRRFRVDALKAMLIQTLPLFLNRACSLFVFQINPVLIVSVLGAAALPDYNALFLLAVCGHQLCLAPASTLMPFVAEKRAAGDADGIRRLLLLCVKVGLSLQLVYTVCLLTWAPTWIGLWLGPGHYLGPWILGLLCVCYLLETHHVCHATFTFSGGRWPYAKWALASAVLNVILVWWGLRWWGLAGAAAGTLLAQLLTSNWFVPYDTLRRLGVPLRHYGARALAPLGLLLALLGVGSVGLTLWPPATPWLWSGIRGLDGSAIASAALGAIALAAVAAGTGWLVFDRRERGFLHAKLRTAWRGL